MKSLRKNRMRPQIIKYFLLLGTLCSLWNVLPTSVASAQEIFVERAVVLLSPKVRRAKAVSSILKRDLEGIGTIEESYPSALKVRLGSKASRKLEKLTGAGQEYCRALRRAVLRKTRFSAIFRSNCSSDFEESLSLLPNDPYVQTTATGDSGPYMWGLVGQYGIGAPSAWNIGTGSKDVVVAVIDTGIEVTHPELADNIWVNPDEVAGNGIDDDGNGYIDDVNGISAILDSGALTDGHGHGTHCSGTIAAKGNNRSWIVGVNWQTTIIGCKFLADSGSGRTSDAIQCVDYITDLKINKGINIVATNNSWGGGGYSAALAAAIDRATQAGIIFVAAAGNRNANIDIYPYYPALYPGVLPVAALDRNGNRASFSNYGATKVPIAAPGVEILSTYKGANYAYMSGTSMATPHVTGALALMASVNPRLSADNLRRALLNSAGALSTLDNLVEGSRQLRVDTALTLIAPTPTPTPSPTPSVTPSPSPTPGVSNPPDSSEPDPITTPVPKKKDDKKKKKRKKEEKRRKTAR